MIKLPTDTAHLNPETRQYEMFNFRLQSGIPRRQFVAGLAVGSSWITLMVFVVQVWSWAPLSLASMVTILPPIGLVYLGTRTDDSGRMAALGLYDRFLFWRRRREPIRNPLVQAAHPHRPPLVMVPAPTEVRTGSPATPVQEVWSRKRTRSGK